MKSYSILIVFVLLNCTSHPKKKTAGTDQKTVTTISIKPESCENRTLKSRLTQIIGKIPGEELLANSGCKNKVFTDSYGRKYQTDKNGDVIIPQKILEEHLLPPSIESFSMDAAIACRLYNMKYFEVSFRLFISLLDLNPHGESNQVFRSWFCRKWKKLKDAGATWSKVIAMVPIGIHRTGKTWKYINHFHNFALQFDFIPVERTKVGVINNSTSCLSAVKSHDGTKEFMLLSLRGKDVSFENIFKGCSYENNSCTVNGHTINYTFRKLPGGLKLFMITSKNDLENIKKYLSVISLVSSSVPCT